MSRWVNHGGAHNRDVRFFPDTQATDTAGGPFRATSRHGRSRIIAHLANHEGQTFGSFTASHFASAEFTATGHSCAIQ
jgi:hypothetical protein